MVWFAVETALGHGLIAHGDTVLVLAGAPQAARRHRPENADGDAGTTALSTRLPVRPPTCSRIVHVE